MDTNAVLSAVKAEIDRLQRVVDLLEPQPTEPVSTPVAAKPTKKGHRWTAKQRAEMSRKLKASWAKRNKK